MKNNQLTLLLSALLLVSVGFGGFCCYRYITTLRAVRQLQPELARINAARNISGALLNESAEYAHKNPALQPLLDMPLAAASPRPNPVPARK